MFNLEKAIQQWLRSFRRHQAFDHGTIREMELHLRDHIDDLLAEGLNMEEAFQAAVAEFGEIDTMADQSYLNIQRRRSFLDLNNLGMYRNHIKVSLRSFTKRPFFTFLNIFGLAIGMAGALLIGLLIIDEFSYDTMFADADQVYRINIDNQTNGEFKKYAVAPGPMAVTLIEDCPQVEMVMRFREVGSTWLRKTGDSFNIKQSYVVGADSAFFQMFGLTLLKGDAKYALKEPNSLVLTKTAAKNIFGEEKALGQQLIVNNDDLFSVTGIIEDLPQNSFLRNYTVFISLQSFEDADTEAWNSWNYPTFVKLHPESKLENLQSFLDNVVESYLLPWAMTFVPGLTLESHRASAQETGNFMRFNTTALTDIHLYSSNREGELSQNGDIENVYILCCIGFFLVLMASVNFMNLSTAYSLQRAKEVGVRKTLGSSRFSLIRQFITEAILLAFIALLFAVVIAYFSMPLFNILAAKNISIPFDSINFWFVLLGSAMLLGLISGSYPAFFLSKFEAIKVLKSVSGTIKGGRVRNLLVIFQFAISVFLIIASIVIYQQVDFIANKDLGFQKDQILILDDLKGAGKSVAPLKEQLQQMTQVDHVSLSSYLPTPSKRSGTTYFTESSFVNGKLNTEQALIIEKWGIDQNYLPALGLEILSGRNFSDNNLADSSAIILNETAVAMLDVSPEQVIGMRLTEDFHRTDKENMEYLTVIGVVKNFHFASLRNNIDAVSMTLGSSSDKMIIRLKQGDFATTVGSIEKKWTSLIPDQPFNYYFMDKSFDDTYRAELRLGRIFLTFTFLSIFIACLGLFGLAAFNAEKRSKEIGIRKVMGANVSQITWKLTMDFLRLIFVATIVAIPIGWYTMLKWLEEFSYRITLNAWVLVIAAAVAIGIAILTVSYQSIKAAIVNPVEGLRSD